MVANNQLSMGHARVLSKLEDQEKIIAMAHEIVEKKLTVREIEQETVNETKKIKIDIITYDIYLIYNFIFYPKKAAHYELPFYM